MELVAKCERSGGWWAVSVESIRSLRTQARRLDQVEAMVADAASLILDRPKSDFTVRIVPVLTAEDQQKIDDAKAARAQLESVEAAAGKASRQAVADLRAQGLTVRDVAMLLGLTPSRVSQLAA